MLVDSNMASVDGSQVSTLRRQNIAVRLHSKTAMLHHKFALVDATASPTTVVTSRHAAAPITGRLSSSINSRKPSRINNSDEGNNYSACALVMSGSLNWTWSAVLNNTENVVISNRCDMVAPFIEHFESLWQQT